MIGSATALTQFARQMGATIGVTVMGVIVNHGLPPGIGDGGRGRDGPPAARVARQALADALKPAFFAAVCVSALVWVIAVVGVKEVPLRRSVDEVAAAEAAAGTPATPAVDSDV